jgi:hypothetical protein
MVQTEDYIVGKRDNNNKLVSTHVIGIDYLPILIKLISLQYKSYQGRDGVVTAACPVIDRSCLLFGPLEVVLPNLYTRSQTKTL